MLKINISTLNSSYCTIGTLLWGIILQNPTCVLVEAGLKFPSKCILFIYLWTNAYRSDRDNSRIFEFPKKTYSFIGIFSPQIRDLALLNFHPFNYKSMKTKTNEKPFL